MLDSAARPQHSCVLSRYPSSLTDEQWTFVAERLPPRARTGRPVSWPFRMLLDAMLYVLRGGIPWRSLPADFPPWQTVYWHFRRLVAGAFLERLNASAVMADREKAGRAPHPTAGVMDSQSVKATEAPGVRSYDGGKKINGQKRHILVDTDGRLLAACISGARLHDSRGGAALIAASRRSWPFLQAVFADSAYAGRRVAGASPYVAVQVVKGLAGQKGFVVQARRWVVERSFAWLGRWRRLWRCCDVRPDVGCAFIHFAAASTLVRRIGRQ